MAKAHRGSPAFSNDELIEYLKENGPTGSTDAAEEFDVTAQAIRARAERMDSVAAKKMWNRWIFYVPHDLEKEKKKEEAKAAADGFGFASLGIPASHYTPLASRFAQGSAWLTLPLVAAHVAIQTPLWPAIVSVTVALLFFRLAVRFQGRAEPSYEMRDSVRALNEGEK